MERRDGDFLRGTAVGAFHLPPETPACGIAIGTGYFPGGLADGLRRGGKFDFQIYSGCTHVHGNGDPNGDWIGLRNKSGRGDH